MRPQPAVPDPTETLAPPPAALDDLLGLGPERLAALYRRATTPRLSALRGDLRGRMLATVVLPAPLEALARAWASSRAFVWQGKSFEPQDERHGEGINRVLGGRLRLFRFRTEISRSRAGEFDALQLDYDRPGNPPPIRAIQDELRELRPRLYLGQAYVQLRGRARLVLYFGLEG